MNYFAKFENFLSHSIIMPSFMTVQSQVPELEEELPLSYKLSSQNAPYKVVLNNWLRTLIPIMNWL